MEQQQSQSKTMAALIFIVFLIIFTAPATSSASICVIGSGIGGSSVAHFLRRYSDDETIGEIRMFERNAVVGGRMATVSIGGETFEAGASILHPKNYHALSYTKHLNLSVKKPPASEDDEGSISLGIWNGKGFVFKTLSSGRWKLPIIQKLVDFANSVLIFFRYGFSLIRMNNFVEDTVNKFLKYYQGFESRPVFGSVEEMLKWSGLYNLTTRTLEDELTDIGLSRLLIQELITVITRINYGQSVLISGLAGAVSLAGSGGGLWAVEGGNWQMAARLINHSDVILHLQEEIESVSYLGHFYELNSTKGNSYSCKVTVIATPLDELNIRFLPEISIPERKLQHTHATFVRGLLNPAYFGLDSVLDIPELIGTIETPDVPFSSISILKKLNKKDVIYKIFSRQLMEDDLLDNIFRGTLIGHIDIVVPHQPNCCYYVEKVLGHFFAQFDLIDIYLRHLRVRSETIKINWAAYPHYHAPEEFAPFMLDGEHLYYVNAFENAASSMETSAVAAENIARLILSRLSGEGPLGSSNLRSFSHAREMHVDL